MIKVMNLHLDGQSLISAVEKGICPNMLQYSSTHHCSSPQHFWEPCVFLSPDQQSGIHCLIIGAIQLLTQNIIGWT